jgi:ABC-type dipeptide/oligopeptide/nickel transport system permease subunit
MNWLADIVIENLILEWPDEYPNIPYLRFLEKFSTYGKIGIAIIIILICLAGYSLFAGNDMHMIPSGESLERPSIAHWLGTDDLGIEILAQIGHGATVSMSVGFASAILAGVGGSVIGIFAAISEEPPTRSSRLSATSCRRFPSCRS